MSTLTQLEYILAVDNLRHFGRAAKACHVTQPTLSMQIHKLEEELGCVLFDRSKKPILPTPLGEEIIAQARQVVAAYHRIKILSDKAHQEVRGDFILGVIPTLAPYLLPRFLGAFVKTYPHVHLTVREMQTATILDALDREEIDGGLLATPTGRAGLFEQVLFYEPFYGYLPAEHPLAQKKRLSENDLDPQDILLLEEGHCLRNQIVKLCGLTKRKGHLTFASGNLETLKSLVDSGVGYTLIPHLAIGSSEHNDRVEIIPFQKPPPSREVSLMYRRDQLKRPILDAVAEEIRKNIPPALRRLDKEEIDLIDI